VQRGVLWWLVATGQHELTGLAIMGVQFLLYPVTPWIVTDIIFYSSLFRCVNSARGRTT
jgi:uncharacterized membrane protein